MENTKESNLQALKIVAAAFILVVICMCSAVSAANLKVDPAVKDGYVTMQAAVDAANEGDTIFVGPGTYVENLKIDKQVRIWSDSRNPGDTIVQAANPAESAVEITADRAVFSGFGVEGSEKAGILLAGASNCYINNNRAQNMEYGILLQDSESNSINGNIITLNEVGLRLESSSSNTVQDNLIAYNYGYGISLEESTRNIIFNNYLKNAENVEGNAINADNTWQSTLTTRSNLVRGPYTGGNFWADLEGTGYSETCVDENSNGICDSAYEVAGGGSDRSPLYPRVPSAIVALDNRLDAEAYEQGVAARDEAGVEAETPGGEQTEEETGPADEGEGATDASEHKATPGPGLGIVAVAVGAAYFLKRRK